MEKHFKNLGENIYHKINEVYNNLFNQLAELTPIYISQKNNSKDSLLEEKISFYEIGHGSKFAKKHKAKVNAGKAWKDKSGKRNNNNDNKRKKRRRK